MKQEPQSKKLDTHLKNTNNTKTPLQTGQQVLLLLALINKQ